MIVLIDFLDFKELYRCLSKNHLILSIINTSRSLKTESKRFLNTYTLMNNATLLKFKILCLVALLALVNLSPAKTVNEITFYTGSWEQAMAEAKKQNKYLFVDAYATWCGPCKYMDKNVFTDAEVATYYNENFISYKLDVDKEMTTAEKYGISAMPTYLFVDAEGEVVFRKTGAMGVAEFIQLGKSALQIPELQKKYESGDRSPEFLAEYLLANTENQSDEILEIADTYFKTQKDEDLLSDTNFQLLKYFISDVNSREFKYFLEHTNDFYEKHGETAGEIAYQVLDQLYSKGY